MDVQKYLDLFQYKYRHPEEVEEEKKEGFWCFTSEALTEGTKAHKLHEPFSKLMMDSGLDMDSRYTFTVEALQAIQERIEDKEFNFSTQEMDFDDYMGEPPDHKAPVYNSELMEWVSKASNYAFVDEVVKEFGLDSNNFSLIEAIQLAYTRAWEEHYFKVLEAINEKSI